VIPFGSSEPRTIEICITPTVTLITLSLLLFLHLQL
jgi:hypothetical protein